MKLGAMLLVFCAYKTITIVEVLVNGKHERRTIMKNIIKKTKKFVGEHKELIIGVGMLTIVFLGGMYVIICTCE